jgi:hypothetical protein
VDAVAAYAPHGTGTAAGLVAFFMSSNKLLGFGMFLGGQAADVVKTFWERREKKRKNQNAD